MSVKFKLNKTSREAILAWMKEEKINKSVNKDEVIAAMKTAITAANVILRLKYPESDMVVLRNSGGCNNNTVFEGTKELKKVIDKFDLAVEEFTKFSKQKMSDYSSFVDTCKNLEDIEAVIPLPEELRTRITGKTSALVCINPDIIKSIASDFKVAIPKKKGK